MKNSGAANEPEVIELDANDDVQPVSQAASSVSLKHYAGKRPLDEAVRGCNHCPQPTYSFTMATLEVSTSAQYRRRRQLEKPY